jgi:hypothetical protein
MLTYSTKTVQYKINIVFRVCQLRKHGTNALKKWWQVRMALIFLNGCHPYLPPFSASASLPLLDDVTALPASRLLASARPALTPKRITYFGTVPKPKAKKYGCDFNGPIQKEFAVI